MFIDQEEEARKILKSNIGKTAKVYSRHEFSVKGKILGVEEFWLVLQSEGVCHIPFRDIYYFELHENGIEAKIGLSNYGG